MMFDRGGSSGGSTVSEGEAVPPDARRCLPVRVADVPLEERVDAIRKFSQDFIDDPAERLTLFDLALSPGKLVAWVAPATSNGGNGKTNVETVARIFELREHGLSGSAIAARLEMAHGTVKSIVARGREEALKRYQELEDEEVARVFRAALSERLAGWKPFATNRNGSG
jgi:hypothetical protein